MAGWLNFNGFNESDDYGGGNPQKGDPYADIAQLMESLFDRSDRRADAIRRLP